MVYKGESIRLELCNGTEDARFTRGFIVDTHCSPQSLRTGRDDGKFAVKHKPNLLFIE